LRIFAAISFMSQHFISRSDAESDLLSCAAYLAESIPSGEAHAEAIAAVVPRYLEKGNVDLAAELANTVDDPFTRDRLLIAIAAKCAEAGDDDYAMQLVEVINEPGFQVQTHERIGFAKAAQGEFEKARGVAENIAHSDNVLAAIAVKQAASGDAKAASATIDEIEFATAAVSALNAIAVGRLRNGESESALENIERSFVRTEEIEHDEERIQAMCSVGNLFIDAGENGRAVAAFDKARTEAEAIDNIHRDRLLALAANGFLLAGSVDLADRTLDGVADKTQIASVVLEFARDHWRKDEKTEAFEALEEAHDILRSQRENETRDSKSKFALLGSVAVQFAGFERAERGIEIAEGIDDENQRSAALSQIAKIAAMQKTDDFAQMALNAINDDSVRIGALIAMSDAILETDAERSRKFLDDANEQASGIAQFGPRAQSYAEIANRYAALEAARVAAQFQTRLKRPWKCAATRAASNPSRGSPTSRKKPTSLPRPKIFSRSGGFSGSNHFDEGSL